MMFHSGDLDYSDPVQRKIAKLNRVEEQRDYLERKKKINKSYLKGQRGKRLYYDYDIVNEESNKDSYLDDDYDEDDMTNKVRPLKFVFTKDIRREKLLQYLIYLKGKKVLIRDLAWKFAVTERTIQSDLKYLINNDFVKREINKTYKGKQTRNSFFVNKEKLKDLHLKQSFVYVVIIAKQSDGYYLFAKPKSKSKQYDIPFKKIKQQDKIDEISFNISKDLINGDLSKFYKGYVYEHITKYGVNTEDLFDDILGETKCKNYFTLFVIDTKFDIKNWQWLKLATATRKINQFHINKAINYISKNAVWVK